MPAWITDAELAYYIQLRGTTLEADTVTERCLGLSDTLLKEAKELTGWQVLVSSGEDVVWETPGFSSVRQWHGSDGMLDVRCALRSVTTLRVMDVFGSPVRTLDTWEYKLDVGEVGYANWLKIRLCMPIDPSTLEITGEKGRFAADSIPDDLIRAAQVVAASRVEAEAAEYSSGARVGWKDGDAAETFDPIVVGRMQEAAEEKWLKVLGRYKRIVV